MSYDYVAKYDASALNFDQNGFSMVALHPGQDVGDVKFCRCALKAGSKVSLPLDAANIVLLVFNGKEGYVTTADELFRITEPAIFAPDFDRTPYTIHAVEDIEFITCVFGMNQWDRDFYKDWHLRFPFFSLYSDGVQFDQDCKLPGTKSWAIIQPFQIGHISIDVVQGIGGGTVEKGHRILHQWNYCLGNSDFELTVGEDDPIPQKPGDWSFIAAGRDHKLVAAPGKEVFYVSIEYFVDEDLQKYYLAQIFNGNIHEVA